MNTALYSDLSDPVIRCRAAQILDAMRHADGGIITLPADTISGCRPHSAMALEHRICVQACQLLVLRGQARRVVGFSDWPAFQLV